MSTTKLRGEKTELRLAQQRPMQQAMKPITTSLLIAFLWIAFPSSRIDAASGTPNIVLILVDDLGWTDLGCYGSDFYQTPHIDRLASEGMKFTNAYAACPACSPTRAAILTGKYPARLRVTDWIPGVTPGNAGMKIPDWTKQLEHRHITIAEALRESGYATAHIGKWHLGNSAYYPQQHGFDENIGGSYIGAPGSYYYPYYRKPGPASGPIENLPAGGPEGRYLTDRLADEAVKWIDSHKDQPFFLYFATYSVHTPIQPRKDLHQKYQSKVKAGERHQHAGYAAMVEAVDEAVGRVSRQLQDSGIAEETIILFTSDNGGLRKVTSNAPLRSGKGFAYEGGVRVPLIIKWPTVTQAGTQCDEAVISTDFFPTFLELVGHDDPRAEAAQDGISLIPLLESQGRRFDTNDHRALYWHYPHYNPIGGIPYAAVRRGRYKLIEFYEDGRVELYDLQEDWGETVDLSGKMPELTSKLHSQLAAWRVSVDAQMPVNRPKHD